MAVSKWLKAEHSKIESETMEQQNFTAHTGIVRNIRQLMTGTRYFFLDVGEKQTIPFITTDTTPIQIGDTVTVHGHLKWGDGTSGLLVQANYVETVPTHPSGQPVDLPDQPEITD